MLAIDNETCMYAEISVCVYQKSCRVMGYNGIIRLVACVCLGTTGSIRLVVCVWMGGSCR